MNSYGIGSPILGAIGGPVSKDTTWADAARGLNQVQDFVNPEIFQSLQNNFQLAAAGGNAANPLESKEYKQALNFLGAPSLDQLTDPDSDVIKQLDKRLAESQGKKSDDSEFDEKFAELFKQVLSEGGLLDGLA